MRSLMPIDGVNICEVTFRLYWRRFIVTALSYLLGSVWILFLKQRRLLNGIQRFCLKTSGRDQRRQGVAIQEEVCMKVDIHLTEEPSSPARFNRTGAMTALAAVLTLGFAVGPVAAALAQEKPNIIFIMGDDIGWSNIGVYNQGIMAGRTPNLDRLASE